MMRLRTEWHDTFPESSPGTVSIVIPCFNYARYLPESIGSVLSQEGVTVEVIVVDDCSTDDSVLVARGLAEEDARITVLVNEHNRGPVHTFNRGLAAARGEYLVRLDADDLLTPSSLQRAVAVMQAFPTVGLVYGHPLHFTEDRPAPRSKPSGCYVWRGDDWLSARCRDATNVITSPEVLMRRSVVDVVGGQRDLAHTHDMEMWLRLAAHADVAYIRGADQAWHRDHPLSLSTRAQDPMVILSEIRDAFDVLFDGEATQIADAEVLHATARRAVAREALGEAQRTLDRGRVNLEVEQLRRFARECDPEVARSAIWKRQEREVGRSQLSSVAGRLAGALRRLRRRSEMQGRRRRWRETGVYEKLALARSQTGGAR